MKNILFTFLILCGVSVIQAQPLFLPPSLNTLRNDYVNGFTEYKGNFYFCGQQTNGSNSPTRDSVKGFCIKTNASGQLLQRIDLSGVLGTPYVRVEAVGHYADHINLAGATGFFDSLENQPHFNKVFVLRLDTNLNFNLLDTFSYGLNNSTSVYTFKTEFLQNKIVMAFSSTLGWLSTGAGYSYVTIYDCNKRQFASRRIDSAFINVPLYSDNNSLIGMTKHSERAVVLSVANSYRSGTTGLSQVSSSLLLVDTTITLLERIDTLEFQPLDTFNKWPLSFVNQSLKHPVGTYFLGPVMTNGSASWLGLAKLNHRRDTVLTTRSLLPRIYTSDSFADPALKMPLLLLKNQKEIVVFGSSNHDLQVISHPINMRVAKYDTSLKLLWHRTVKGPDKTFIPFGIYELSDNRLMVLASAYNYTTRSTIDSNYNLLRLCPRQHWCAPKHF